MRVVDDHGERLALVDELEPPGHAVHGFDAVADRVLADAERARRRRCPESILEVEAAAQLEVRVERVAVRVEDDRIVELGREAPAPRVADVDDRTLRLREEPALRGEVRPPSSRGSRGARARGS